MITDIVRVCQVLGKKAVRKRIFTKTVVYGSCRLNYINKNYIQNNQDAYNTKENIQNLIFKKELFLKKPILKGGFLFYFFINVSLRKKGRGIK